jgi:hypothetical protein
MERSRALALGRQANSSVTFVVDELAFSPLPGRCSDRLRLNLRVINYHFNVYRVMMGSARTPSSHQASGGLRSTKRKIWSGHDKNWPKVMTLGELSLT